VIAIVQALSQAGCDTATIQQAMQTVSVQFPVIEEAAELEIDMHVDERIFDRECLVETPPMRAPMRAHELHCSHPDT
jgi:hypothetical protein